MPSKTHYQTLEIPTDANEREIKRAYHRLAKQLHPDRASNPDEGAQLEEQMAQVSQAYNVLKDPAKRSEYDASIQRTVMQQAAVATAEKPKPAKSVSAPKASGSDSKESASAPGRRVQIAAKALAKAQLLLKQGEVNRALEFLQAAVDNNDQDATAHAMLANLLVQCGRSLSRATEHAEKAIEIDPWNVDHRITLASIYEARGIKSRALEAYKEVFKWDANNPVAKAKIRELGKSGSDRPFGGFFDKLLGRKG